MKKVLIVVISFGLFGIATSSALADKTNGPKAKILAKYDKNHNGVIDEDEKEAIRKDYAANPNGELKRFDKNHDGKLDDDEIAAIKPGAGKTKAAKGQKAGKSGTAGQTDKTADKPADQAGQADKTAKSDQTQKTEKTDQ